MIKANRNDGKCKYSKPPAWQTHESLRALIIGDQAGLSFIPNFKFTKESILLEMWMDSKIFLLKLFFSLSRIIMETVLHFIRLEIREVPLHKVSCSWTHFLSFLLVWPIYWSFWSLVGIEYTTLLLNNFCKTLNIFRA